MKVFISHRPGGAFGYISDSWINAFRDVNIEVARWDGKSRSWDLFAPDLYIGCSGHQQDIPVGPKRKKTKVAIHVNPYCIEKIQPNINEQPHIIEWVKSKSPDVVFGYGHEHTRTYWSHWIRDGIYYLPMGTAGDATQFKPHNRVRPNAMVYLGGRWAYKATNIDKYLLPAIKEFGCVVRGWGDWPQGVCDGELSDDQASTFLASGIVGPCICEPHTSRYGIDIPERVYKVILSGTIAVHDYVQNISKILPNLLVANDPTDFIDKIKTVLRMDDISRLALARSQFNDVITAHTYHHRLAALLDYLRFKDEANKLLNKVNEYRI